jgi:hypothetical protein
MKMRRRIETEDFRFRSLVTENYGTSTALVERAIMCGPATGWCGWRSLQDVGG